MKHIQQQRATPLIIPNQSLGLGYRPIHHDQILTTEHNIEWFEALADNYLDLGSISTYKLQEIAERFPIVLHSVGMSLASPDSLDRDYMNRLKKLKHLIKPKWMSDHLCWSSRGDAHFHDLLPLPYTLESAKKVATKIKRAQDFLEERICIENLSSYISYKTSAMSEAEFIAIVCEQADCDILLDVNNIVVSAKNHRFEAKSFVQHLSPRRIKQIHLAGYTDCGSYYLDTHSNSVYPSVWDLYSFVIETLGPIPTMVEWDGDIPDFDRVVAEINLAKQFLIYQKDEAIRA